jgi:hypothetical protein
MHHARLRTDARIPPTDRLSPGSIHFWMLCASAKHICHNSDVADPWRLALAFTLP